MSEIDYQSWGRFPAVSQGVLRADWRDEVPIPADGTVLPFGKGRSYGDCCLNDGGVVLDVSGLDRFISLDEERGLLECEAGVTLEEILRVAVPRGWFLPVSPGTKFVTVGGAIANDIHGKNHHRAGTFGRHVRRFELLRSNGERITCSASENSELFSATIGGIGLTGLILRAEIQLMKVAGPYIDYEGIRFGSIDEFFEISSESSASYEYTVAWLDCLARGKSLGRGIFMRGNHAARTGPVPPPRILDRILTVPFDFPGFALNRFSVRAFNTCYYHKQREKIERRQIFYEPFFYPLDGVKHWNRIYGKRGFVQFQGIIASQNRSDVRNLLEVVAQSGRASFLVVFKEFGDLTSPGMMSFPRPGATICLDFPYEGKRTIELLRRLEEIVMGSGGALYPAKDACMLPESFQRSYPRWKEFSEFIDPAFSSSFWRRVTRGQRA